LKKVCRFGIKTFRDFEHGRATAALWQAFIRTKSSNKKVFNIIFGFPAEADLDSEFSVLAKEFREFKTVSNKYGVEAITQSQECIRAKVYEEVNKLTK
jgi:hypothetical protein